MDNFGILKTKLRSFIKRYYTNELLRGFIFFVAAGLLYFLLTLFIEHIFWLEPIGRTILFWSFVLVEIFLFGRFIVYPLLKLSSISKGIDDEQAAVIIGKHFPEVQDKLLNVLQLNKSSAKTDLLLAGVDQKAVELKPVPFSMAVDFKKNVPYLNYAAVPILIILLIIALGKTDIFSSSYERVVNYKTAYEPPAPFSFRVNEENLRVRENEPFILEVFTEGNMIPEDVSVHYQGQNYYLNAISPGVFQFAFEPVQESFQFRLSGNKVTSKPFAVEVIKVPRTLDLQMALDFPAYTGLDDQYVEGTGNATIPEGTTVSWKLKTSATDQVHFVTNDTIWEMTSEDDIFSLSSTLMNSADYQIRTSNREIKDFENLSYSINVIQDEFPKLELEHRQDSIDGEIHYFYGKVSDDYGINAVNLITVPVEKPESRHVLSLDVGKGTVGDFLAVFPDTLTLEKGRNYEIFFEVTDNDAVNGYKKIRSESFFFRKQTAEEEKEERLEEQNNAIQKMENSLEELNKSQTEWEEFRKLLKEKSQQSFEQRQEVESFLKRQKKQNEMMQSFSEKLKKTLEEEEKSYNEDLRKDLQERLKKREEELKESEKLLEELEKYSEKLQEEGLREKLEKMSKGAKTRERNLEQLLELTKKYYVQEKLQKLSDELEELAKEQENLSEQESVDKAKGQDSLTEKTKEVLEELKELGGENEILKKPIDLGRDEQMEKEIPQDQKKASEEIKKGDQQKAKKEQKKAAKKMKELSGKMKQQMQMAGMQNMQEDVDMLRKILDNLIVFSFEQEEVMEEFKKIGNNSPSFSAKLREQNFLKENFEHIDDSIYALALRNQLITEQVTNKLVDVEYNLDKSLDRLAQNEVHLGVGSQQYVVTGANDLAYFLSSILGNMQEMLNQAAGKGEGGSGQGMQLPDIIEKQGELNKEMQKGLEKGKEKGQGEGGEKGEKGRSEKESEELFRIFQEQQMLRMALEEKLKQDGTDGKDGSLKKEMEQIEKEILEKGFNRETLERMIQLEHKLLELDDAKIHQGQKEERKSEVNQMRFENDIQERILKAKEYFNTTEILNRQTLPLRRIYSLKVKQYFERGDH